MTHDNKNFFLAIALSLFVLVGWNYIYGVPQIEKSRQAASQAASQAAPAGTQSTVPGAPVVQGAPGVAGAPSGATTSPVASAVPLALTREIALARTPRIAVDTPKLTGSISLRGARIDDVVFKTYRETVEPASPNIVLFSPTGGPNAYYAEFGWVGGAGVSARVPNTETVWTADTQRLTQDRPVTLTYDNGEGLTFRRTIAIDADAMFTVTDAVENKSAAAVALHPYGLVSRHGKPVVQGYFILHEGLIGVMGEQGLQEVTYDSVEKENILPGNSRGKAWQNVSAGFVGITDKYWAAAIIPDQSRPFSGRLTTSVGGPIKTYQADVFGDARNVAPGAAEAVTTRLFAGPKEVALIDGYEKNLGIKKFDLLIDWGWFYFITKPLFKLMDYVYRVTGNFGIAILLATVLVKIVFFPLANKSYTSMAKMKAVQPEMLALRDRFADDKMRQQQELMSLYKREKINPLAGCWPVLLQIPVFFALYKVLFVTIEMRHAPFFGWIKDLAAPDPTSIFNLFGLIPFTVPQMLLVGIWPIIMGITMFVQMKMNPEPTDPVQKMLFSWMPLLFTFMLASFPAGLVIYWSWNNLLSVLQQGYIMKKNGTKIELFDNVKGLFTRKAKTESKAD
jgi:YidC/Oxa1 family membrane protein insertase